MNSFQDFFWFVVMIELMVIALILNDILEVLK